MKANRLEQLEENIVNLATFKKENTKEAILANRTLEWSLRYGLFETIQITIDISCHVAAKHNFGSTKSYRECIDALCAFDVLDTDLCDKLKRIVGLRNILIHEYVKIDVSQLYEYLENLDDFRKFAKKIAEFVPN
jgi:uncharacterized protein YutE (UPF0331/DUF86 family)